MTDGTGTLHISDTDMEIHKVVVGPMDNNVFVLRCRHRGDAVLIDAANEHDVLLDLHSFQAQGQAFVMVGPQNNTGELEPTVHGDTERDWALRLGVKRAVDGWLGTYAKGVDERRARAERQPASEGKRHDLDAKYGVGTTEYMRRMGGGVAVIATSHETAPAGATVQ